VKPGIVVLAHISLSSLGWVADSEHAVVGALRSVSATAARS
jgi:aminoglycoside N3'-acetyltransferase